MNPLTYENLHENLRKLDLIFLETRIDGLLDDFSKKDLSQIEFINMLLAEEIENRKTRSIKTRIKLAKFPYQKTIDDFNFGFQPDLDKERVIQLFSLKFVIEKGNVMFLGPPGVGKTHLAIALGIAACQNGYTSYFLTFQDLVTMLKKADEQGRLKRKIQSLCKPHLLIIDEMGYLPLNLQESNLFFQLICGRYLKGSVLLTSNKAYGDWAEVFPQEAIAAAILDRLLESSATIKIIGDSYRIKDKKKIGLFN